MAAPQNRKRLAHAIAEIWRRGLTLSPEALHYIDSTFSRPSLQELQGILAAESDCERDSLLELLFFPDQSVQVQLEALLESDDFQTEDEEEICRALAAENLAATFIFPDGRGRLTLSAPGWAVECFLARLNITAQPPPSLAETIRREVPEPHRALCRVRLRNARSVFSADKVSFLCLFFEKMKRDFGQVLEGFDFLLAFFEEVADNADLYSALMRKKRSYIRSLQKAQKFETRLKESNMETLLMQGVRMAYIDQADARRKIGLIDVISRAVFGKTEFFADSIETLDLGEYARENGLPAALKFLS